MIPHFEYTSCGLSLYLANPGITVVVVNTTLSRNSGGNMAIESYGNVSVNISHTTFHGGQAVEGGG